jgi:hypothetical protein
MPWTVRADPRCPVIRPYAVVNQANNVMVSCHSSRPDADAALAALYASQELETGERASDSPWGNYAPSDYSPEQWRRACLIDRGTGDPADKSRYSLPVREPGGAVNKNGVHAAAARLNQVQGISPDKRATAARALLRLYSQIGDEPPDSLKSMAGASMEHRSFQPVINPFSPW